MRRALPVVIGLLIVVAGVGGLILFLQSRDEAGIESSQATGPGVLQEDLGASHDGKAQEGATSGPHQPDNITRDARRLTPDQIVHALELGDVVITYPGDTPPAPLLALQEKISGRFDAELAANGLAVVLAEGDRLEALAWRRKLSVDDPADPRLEEFAEHWLGRGGIDR